MIGKIEREDMLELTRRMTINGNCFHRIVGAYFDSEGYVDGMFNTHFQKLSRAETECGFLFPAYKERGGAEDFVDVYGADHHPKLLKILNVQ